MTNSEPPQRPPGVPPEAWFSQACSLWSFGPRNEAGEPDGDIHYWDDTGTLVSITGKKNGKPHGAARRFHDDGTVSQTCDYVDGALHGTRVFFPNSAASAKQMTMGENVRRAEFYYDHGLMTGARYFDGDGEPVARDGCALSVPPGVPPDAIAGKNGTWATGTWNEAGDKHGEISFFLKDGTLAGKETYQDGVAHGRSIYFHPGGGVQRKCSYRDGKLDGLDEAFRAHGVKRSAYTYEQGVLRHAEQFHRNGQLARRVDFAKGVFEDFERSGEVSEVRHVPKPLSLEPLGLPPLFDLIDHLPSTDAVASLRAQPLSPRDVAHLLAFAFGGDENRDTEYARAARGLVRGYDDPELQAVLHETGLDTAPRLWTCGRARRFIEGLEGCESVDVPYLVQSISRQGGPAALLALGTPSTLSIELLERRRTSPERLLLSGMGLDALPTALRYLPGVRIIEAHHNAIESVPVELTELILLSKLSLSSNGIRRLPPELARLRELEQLMLSANELDQVPEVLWSLDELTTLGLGQNLLVELPDRFDALARLDTLWLNDNPLEGLPRSMARLSSLTFLHLGGVPWRRPPEVIFEIESLETLWLASSALEHLPEEIGQLRNLRMLSLWYSKLEQIPKALFEMTHLEELRIKNNPLPPHTLAALKEALPDCKIY